MEDQVGGDAKQVRWRVQMLVSYGGVSGLNGISLNWLWWASASRAVMSSLMAGIVSLKMFFTENVLLALNS